MAKIGEAKIKIKIAYDLFNADYTRSDYLLKMQARIDRWWNIKTQELIDRIDNWNPPGFENAQKIKIEDEEINPPKKKIYIISKDGLSAKTYCESAGIAPDDYVYVSDQYSLKRSRGVDIRFVGQWREREDAEEIERVASIATGRRVEDAENAD